MRVGIATGLVIVGDLVGEGAAQEEAVIGETPNLAARMQTLAEPGWIVIAEATRRLLGDLFDLTDLGSHELKGLATPVQAWRVNRASRAEGRFEALHGLRLSPLVGREQELALLLDRWRKAEAGEGQVVLLSAEPGIGKSRIALALRHRLRGGKLMSLRYYGSPYHTNSALFPIIDQLERAAGFARDDTPADKLAKLEALLGIADFEPEAAVRLFGDLLAVPTGESYPPLELAPEQKKAKISQALLAQLEGLATRQPVLMTVEDVHWFDPTSLELFDLIVERTERLPVLLVITFRPEFAPRWTRRPHVTLLTLNRFGRADGAALIDYLTGGRLLPANVFAQILSKTEGVPLFIEEVTKAVLESGFLRKAGERYELTGPLPAVAVPATLHDSLMARLDRLTTVKAVAQIASVIGREFSYELLSAIANMEMADLTVALDELVRAELVFRQGAPSEGTYAFKHGSSATPPTSRFSRPPARNSTHELPKRSKADFRGLPKPNRSWWLTITARRVRSGPRSYTGCGRASGPRAARRTSKRLPICAGDLRSYMACQMPASAVRTGSSSGPRHFADGNAGFRRPGSG